MRRPVLLFAVIWVPLIAAVTLMVGGGQPGTPFEGDSGDDRITGTSGPDEMSGSDGRDTMFGRQ